MNLYTFLHECNSSIRTFVLKMDTVFHLVSFLWDQSHWKTMKKTSGLVAQDTNPSLQSYLETNYTMALAWALKAG